MSTYILPAGKTITLTATAAQTIYRESNSGADDSGIGASVSNGAVTYGPYTADTYWEVSGGTVTISDTRGLPLITVSGAAHNILATEDMCYIRYTGTGAKTCTFRPDATEALPSFGEWTVRNAAESGNVTLTPGSGVTLNAPADGSLVLEPGMTCTAKRIAANVFDVIGQTVAA